jgi:hypothetical protein
VPDLYDTTLRDGTQREGISLTVADKLKVAGTSRTAAVAAGAQSAVVTIAASVPARDAPHKPRAQRQGRARR